MFQQFCRIGRLLALCASCLTGLAACGSPVDGSAPSDALSRAESPAGQPASALEPATAAVVPGESAAMMVFVDPETGERVSRPMTEAQRQMARSVQVDRSSEGLEVVRRPDGSIVVDLQGRFQHTAVARRGPDGSVQLDCDTDAEPLGQGAAARSSAPSPLE